MNNQINLLQTPLFTQILKGDAELKDYIIQPEGASRKWGRLVCRWDELKPYHTILKHIYTPVIDLQNGDIYMDCNRRTIVVRLAAHVIIRPVYSVFMTIYHIGMTILIPHSLYYAYNDNNPKKFSEEWTQSVRTLADIVRTPLYGVAMTITSLAGVLAAPFSAQVMFDMRKVTSKLLLRLHWDNKKIFFMCLTPQKNMKMIESQWWQRGYTDTRYGASHLQRALANFARSRILPLREEKECFYGCKELDPDKSYVSKASRSLQLALLN